jgi:transposase
MRNSKHTREFRDSAIQLVLNSSEEIKDLAEDLGVNPKTLYNWVYNYKRDNNLQTYNRTSSKSSIKESSEEELRRLRKENRLLKQERDILKKSNRVFCEGNSIKYAWIKEHQKSFNITVMCRVLKVNRSAYYHWVNNGCIINKVDERLNNLIKDIFYQYREVYGTRRIKKVFYKNME